ncbi:uncharacterized protein LOC131656808 [Vicia villosa]|uniref:uncharacterized protein LOC131656808 n=1 Tax=Vicia villosa TaxID=3911 RepID=UPI00273B1D6B|nr:uncharacterized protein LOC131656808 [Vicia villosa]
MEIVEQEPAIQPSAPIQQSRHSNGWILATSSVILCFLLIIFPDLKKLSHGLNKKHVLEMIIPLVVPFQLALPIMMSLLSSYKSMSFGIWIAVVLTSVITSIEMSLVSSDPAIFISIGWKLFAFFPLLLYMPLISCEDAVFSKLIQGMVLIYWILFLVCLLMA